MLVNVLYIQHGILLRTCGAAAIFRHCSLIAELQ